MKARRAVLLAAVSIAALLAAYAAAGIWLAPKLLREHLPQLVERELGHKLEISAARIDPFRLRAEIEGARLASRDGVPLASFARLSIDLELDSIWRRAWHFREITLAEPRVDLALDAQARLNWSPFVDALAKSEGGPAPPLAIERLALRQGTIAFSDRSREASADLLVQPVEVELLQVSTASGKRASGSAGIRLEGGGSLEWRGGLTLEPLALEGHVALDGLPAATAWRFADPSAKPPQGTLRASTKVSFRGDPRSLALEELAAKLEAFSLELADGARLSLGALTLAPSRYRVFEREGELGVLQLESLHVAVPANGLEAKLARAETGAVSVRPGAQTIRVARASLGGASLEAPLEGDAGRASAALEQAELGAIEVAIEPARVSLASAVLTGLRTDTPPEASGTRGMARIERVETGALHATLDAPEQPVVSLERAVATMLLSETPVDARGRRGRASLERLEALGLRVVFAERALSLQRVALAAPRYEDAFDEHGKLSAARLFERLVPPEMAPAAAAATPWRIELGTLQAIGGSARLEDHGVSPAGRIDLRDIRASAERLTLPGAKPAQVSASLVLKPGAKIAARGRLALAPFAVDLELEAQGIALAAAQPWLARTMRPRLDSGTLSTRGRLRAGSAAAKDGARLAFDGALSVAGLRLLEAASGDEFASLRALQTEALKLRIAPTSIEIDELALLQPSGKLLITQDGSTNLANAFGPQDQPASTPKTAAASAQTAFAVNRVTVENAKLAFSDDSLKPPFATRIHELSGVVSGLSSDPGAAARLQLDGRVDEFGSARIRGRLDPKAPRTLTDVTLQFRNLPIEALNPYTAKFAGRRIESGRLSAELRYRVRDSQLKGENQLTIERLKLGERVQEPGAPDLPLDLAVALLTDLDGRLRLGIPVEGDLSDPKFDTRALVSRAIASAIGKVVTAPFQLLAALLRRDAQELDRIDFDAGSAKLPPPEREKIATLTKALAERPQIALAVHGQFDRKVDGEALRALSVRRALAQRMGIDLRPDEDPGPLGLSDPRAAKAAEALYAERFGAAALKDIKPPAREAAQQADARALARARVQAMIEQLTTQAPLAENMLDKLAEQRAKAAREALIEAGTDPSRIALAKPATVEASPEGVPTRLSLEAR